MASTANSYNRNNIRKYSSKNEDVRYEVRYGADANAALQPQFVPYPEPQRPERAPQRRPRVLPPVQPGSKPQQQPRTEKKRSHALLMLAVTAIAVMAFAVVMRNSEIYQNNRQIQEMGSQITHATHELNTVKQELSAKEDMGAYMEYAENELDFVFVDSENYYVISAESVVPETDLTQQSNSGNIIDSILDWISSLERRG
jgi:cell division protein FtsL